uniref:Chondroitin proteoglycan 3 n=1 Tax=Acrobeloides nanus TaxID=290746 RepID=A0A914CP52_9BILA
MKSFAILCIFGLLATALCQSSRSPSHVEGSGSPDSSVTPDTKSAQKNCTAAAVCYNDRDCNGGRCLGFFNGKCNCNACLNFLTCKDDTACGGLNHACMANTSRCDCFAAHRTNGFPTFFDAMRELCNVKDCNGDNEREACFGLPCNSGLCAC